MEACLQMSRLLLSKHSDANFCQACGKPKSSEPTQGVRSNVEDVNLEKENMQAFFFVNT